LIVDLDGSCAITAVARNKLHSAAVQVLSVSDNHESEHDFGRIAKPGLQSLGFSP